MSINFDNALKAHADWKQKLRNAITEHTALDAEAIAHDDRCEIGKWLHGEALDLYGRRADYRECLEAHAHFHKAAANVARAINAGAYESATKMLSAGTEYANASTDVTMAIYQFRKHVEQAGKD